MLVKIENEKVLDFIENKIEQIKTTNSVVDKMIYKESLETYMLALVDTDYLSAHEYLQILSEFKYL